MTAHRAYMSVGMKASNWAYRNRHMLKAGLAAAGSAAVTIWKNRRKK